MSTPWRASWGVNKSKATGYEEEVESHRHKMPPNQKKVTFSLRSSQKQMYEDTEDPRNLGVARTIRNQFKSNPSTRFFPDVLRKTETQASFANPSLGPPPPVPLKYPKVRVISNNNNPVHEDFHDPYDKVKELQSRILAGENVSMHEIHAVRDNVDRTRIGPRGIVVVDNLTTARRLKRKPVFCYKGIVKIPTPHTPHSGSNSFGSPADLRISLSNSDTAEFQDRRRYFFDFTGFRDEDIKLYLESTRRLIINASRPARGARPEMSIEEIIDLPKNLPVDNLRIVRDLFGTLIVEEAWKFG